MIHRILNRAGRELRSIIIRAKKMRYRFGRAAIGSPDWLIRTEIKYGGYVTNVPRMRVSPNDPRSQSELRFGGMTGGDRMYDNGYAEIYSRYLSGLIGSNGITVVEVGILQGTGLAIWSDLFPQGEIIGLDIDLKHFYQNRGRLLIKGAFSSKMPEVYEFDQLGDDCIADAEKIFRKKSINVVIDDGLHSVPAIANTFAALEPFLAKDFVYFVEDFANLVDKLGHAFDGFDVNEYGAISVIHRAKEQDI